MLDERGKAEPHDWTAKLDQLATNEVDRVVIERERRSWPVDLVGGQRHHGKRPLMGIDPKLRQAILDTQIGFIAVVSTVAGTAEELIPTILPDAEEAA
jgi:hypothetical protein